MAKLLSGTRIYGNITVDTYLATTGNVVVGGNLLTTGNAILGSGTTSNVVVAATTTSISTTTGALVVKGGAGIVGNVYADKFYTTTGLYWAGNGVAFSSGGGGTGLTYTAATTPPPSGNIKGDQWYNTSTDTLFEYINDGTSSYWVDTISPTTTSNTFNINTLGETSVSGNIIPSSNVSYTLGNVNYRWKDAYIGGNVSVGSNISVSQSGLFQGPYDENSLSSGVFVGNTGAGTPSPRIGFYTGVTSLNWQIDNYGGVFRWFVPGATRMTLDQTGNLAVSPGNVTVAGNTYVTGNAGIVQPNRTAFRVTGAGSTQQLNANLTASNWSVDYQQGFASTALNGTTGIFTAPIAGLYQTSLTARTSTNTNSSIIQAVIQQKKSGSIGVAMMIEWGNNTSFNHASGSTTVRLAVGDQLWVSCLAAPSGQGFSFDGNDHWDVVYIG